MAYKKVQALETGVKGPAKDDYKAKGKSRELMAEGNRSIRRDKKKHRYDRDGVVRRKDAH